MARIMVVEDEPVTATDLEHKLTALGHDVVGWSDNGEEAVAQARALAPDLVLMDIRLRGEISGIEAAQQLRQQSEIPIVFLTAFADQDTVDRACETLPYGYLLKPFTERSIVAAVQVALARAREEQARAARERWLAAGLRSAGEALIAVDELGAIRYLNEHAEALLGVRASEVLGEPACSLVRLSDEQAPDATHPLELALREGRVTSPARPSRLLAAAGGAPIMVFYSAAPVVAADQTQAGAVLILREARPPFGREASDALDTSSGLSALSMRLTHEINNPLTYNLGALQLALRELDKLRAMSAINAANDPDTAQREAQLLRIEQLLRDAHAGASRVAGVMRELAALSLVDEDVAPLHPAELLDLAIGLSGVGTEHVRFEQQAEPAPIVQVSKWQLARVLALAVQDAVTTLDTQTPKPTTLTLKLGSDARGWAELRITAAGQRAAVASESALAGAIPQSSVGTLVSEQLVARCGGELTICARPEGRVVTLCLPPMNVASLEPELGDPVPTRGSVLVIDDEPLVGRVLELSLQAEHDVTTVLSAEDGLALLERGDAFDAILCDLTMPGMDGQEFYELLSKTRPDLAQRVILMTGGATTERAQRFVNQMAGRRILKPFSTNELLPMLTGRVRARRSARTAQGVPRRAPT